MQKPIYSIEAEQSVLGSMLLSNAIIHTVERKIKLEDFFSAPNRIMFSAICTAYAQHGVADLVNVSDLIENDPEFSGGVAYIAEVAKNTPSAANVHAYIDIMLKNSHQRKVVRLTQEIADAAHNGEDTSELAAELAGLKLGNNVKPLFNLEQSIMRMEKMVFEEPAPVDGVFDECMPMGEPCILTAPGGVGKSFTTIQMAIAVALKKPVYMGVKPFLNPSKQGKVVIIAGEDGEDDYHRRLFGIMKEMGLSAEQKLQILSNVLITSLRGTDIRIIAEDKGSAVKTQFVDRLAETLAPWGEVRMIIADPMIRFYGANENDNGSATMLINEINRLCNVVDGNPAVCLVHHSSKAEKGGSRGASAFVDGCRTHLSMMTLEMKKLGTKETINPGDRDKIVLEMKKSNHFKYWPEPVMLERGDYGTLKRMNLDDDALEAREMARLMDRDRKLLIMSMMQNRPQGVTKREFDAARLTLGWEGEMPSRDKARDLLDELIESGAIVKGDGSRYMAASNVNKHDDF